MTPQLYHASFKGKRRSADIGEPLKSVSVLLMDTSIHNLRARIERRYDFVSGLCLTNCASADLDFFELDYK
mgnify:FL=1